jgi:hypothetical protein
MKTLLPNVLDKFPNIELFYNVTYKKVSNYNLILAIPQGNKCFIWFTKINGKKIIVLINIKFEDDKNYIFLNTSSLDNKFNNELVETILYGTSFMHQNKLYFAIEDLFYYKKNNVSRNSFCDKLNIINNILNEDIYKIDNFDNSIIFGTPPMCENYFGLNNYIKNLPYRINELKYILSNENHVYVKYKNQNQNQNQKQIIKNQKKIFKVVAEMKTDIYNLYLLNVSTNEYEFHSIAFIPDYKLSVAMNKLFHGLKDYNNLDYLEDSDDEFDTNINLEDNWKMMECIFNTKFKKWTPVKVIE